MKIGIITNLYPPFIRGGAEIIASIEAEGLKKAWQHVFVISSRPHNVKIKNAPLIKSPDFISVDEVNEVPVFRFSPINIYYYLNDFKYPGFVRMLWHFIDMFNVFTYFKVKKILEKEKPDVIITHNLMGLGFLIPMLLRKLKIKHVHTIHDVQMVTPSGLIIYGKENAWQHIFFKMIGYVSAMRFLMGSPDIVVSPSKFLLDFYEQSKFFAKSKKVVLPNPVKTFVKMEPKPSYNLELLYLGQMHKAKGVLELIKSFRKLKMKDIRLHIVGVGVDLEAAKKLANGDKRILFHGWLNHNMLLPLMAKADVLVVPSLCYENSPTVIYESLGMGMPVLAADIGGVAELIKEGLNGWVFPANDWEAMNKKILGIQKQRDKVKAMGDNCRVSVKDNSLEKYTDKILKLIHNE